jgi:hypothetical protein
VDCEIISGHAIKFTWREKGSAKLKLRRTKRKSEPTNQGVRKFVVVCTDKKEGGRGANKWTPKANEPKFTV